MEKGRIEIERSEEVRDIIGAIPDRGSRYVLGIGLTLALLLVAFGYGPSTVLPFKNRTGTKTFYIEAFRKRLEVKCRKSLLWPCFRGMEGGVSPRVSGRGFVLPGKAGRTFGIVMGFSLFQFTGLREFCKQMFPCNAVERFERTGIMPGSVYV